MTGKYYSQKYDKRWKDFSYTNIAAKKSTVTIATSGCGPTSGAMAVSSLLGREVWPDEIAQYALEHGHRVEGVGTAYSLFPAIAKLYGLSCVFTEDVEKLMSLLRSGYMAVMGCKGSSTALFSTGGHIIALMGVSDDGRVIVHDPYLYGSKYTKSSRAPLVSYKADSGSSGWLSINDCTIGFDMLVKPETIAANVSQGFYCMKRDPPPEYKYACYTVTASALNIRAGAGQKYAVVGKRFRCDRVVVTETFNGWGRLMTGGWCSMAYLRKARKSRGETE